MAYRVYFQSIHDVVLDEETMGRLHPHRQSRLLSYRKEDDRKRCAAAGLLLWQHVYLQHPERFPVSINAYGKPVIDGGASFNLSHTGTLAMLAVHDSPIGCDLQMPKKTVLSRHVFHPHELSLLQTLPEGPERDRLFLRLWTAKEAFLKAIGTGLSTDAASWDLSSGEVLCPQTNTIWRCDYLTPPQEPDYLACVCTRACEKT